jgi:hypothetical protein
MTCPPPFGWFHLMWFAIIILTPIILHEKDGQYSEKKLKTILGTYSIVALTLEILKQIIYSAEYNVATSTIYWDFQWYAAPFQLCTTPIYACLIVFCLDENSKLRKHLLSYVAFITILGSIATLFYPGDCFTENIIVNIHTTWLHFGSLIVSIYLVMSKTVELNAQSLIRAIKTFVVFVCIAQLLNISVYQSGILNGETFNMFYISPYFVSSLLVFREIYQNVPYPLFLASYIFALSLGGFIIFGVEKFFAKEKKHE